MNIFYTSLPIQVPQSVIVPFLYNYYKILGMSYLVLFLNTMLRIQMKRENTKKNINAIMMTITVLKMSLF